MTPRAFSALVAVVLIAFVAAALFTGSAAWLVPGAVLLVLLAGYSAINFGGGRRADGRDLASDHTDPVPSAHLFATGDDTPLGATDQAHDDDMTPHDFPKSSPARAAAGERFERDGVTERQR